MVEDALCQIELGFLQKVVLARKTTFFLKETPDPLRIIASLETKTEGAALFCIQRKKTAFLGASPERLFRREGKNLFLDALAGTRKKGEEFSSKEVREFQFVKDYLRQSNLCEQMNFSPMRVHQTANVQHLYAQGTGILNPNISDLHIVQALHPTPALCGVPQNKSFAWIGSHEPFRRGLYGALLGWSREEDADSIICIRCCMIEKGKIHFYTGAGIVAGSDADAEWEELETKLSLYEEIIQCGHASIN
jgi:menaquinone-specific isochorismate synthase